MSGAPLDPPIGGVTREQLLAGGRLPQDKIEIEGVGVVTVRGLNRKEALQVRESGDTPEEQEPWIIHFGMVEPALSLDDAEAWCRVAPAGELQELTVRIAELSGMVPGQAKDATKSVPRRRRR